jgi:hypothetical protein
LSNASTAILALAFKRHFNKNRVVPVSNGLHHRIINARADECTSDRFISRSLLEPRGDYGSAFEIDPEVERLTTRGLPENRRTQTREHHQYRDTNEPAPATQPIYIYIVKDLKHDNSLNT